MHKQIFLDSGLTPQIRAEWQSSWLCNSALVRPAIVAGWIDWSDVNLRPRDVSEYIHGNQKDTELQFKLEFLLARTKA